MEGVLYGAVTLLVLGLGVAYQKWAITLYLKREERMLEKKDKKK